MKRFLILTGSDGPLAIDVSEIVAIDTGAPTWSGNFVRLRSGQEIYVKETVLDICKAIEEIEA